MKRTFKVQYTTPFKKSDEVILDVDKDTIEECEKAIKQYLLRASGIATSIEEVTASQSKQQ